MSEEAFFRAFLQRQLTNALSRLKFGAIIGIGVSAALFGLAHFAGGWRYVGLATVAGVGYGYVFHRTQRVEMSMLGHFSVNACQFLFFSYPYL
jgi:membrane protease YdiL (CAAX protease family)